MTASVLSTATALSVPDFLAHWQGHRALTRRVIQAFPEEQLFTFSVGGMRPFGVQATEIHLVSAMTVDALHSGQWPAPDWAAGPTTQAELLREWDALSERLSQVGASTDPAFFSARHALPWGEMPGWVAAIYAIDNEIHHRAQGYVFLRALGLEPPAFYER
ncbi:DinB family protein [Deinococcus multiflagellatus]|uniref:DinB family protein n=1 Tax=Deinococcus multiflagellatus TaxID=1656887 RepID=A0ABW1ZLC5_9DEIO|nr:DinB family protein [Deinococcus multiflagellatus]MBZ9713459.1 DinB family protein [Deinococcus multiflagellatus]